MDKVNHLIAKTYLRAYVNKHRAYQESRQDIVTNGGTYLRSIREQMKWSQNKLAEKLGVHHSHISHLEHGRMELSPSMAERLLQAIEEAEENG